MVTAHPTRLPSWVLDDPARRAEIAVFEALRSGLPEKFDLLYSVAWTDVVARGSGVDGEADFVIAHPDLGIIVIEVKGGGIGRDGHSGQWTSRDRNGEIHPIKDPFEQARRNKYALLEQLRSRPVLGSRWLDISHCVVLPDCLDAHFDLGIGAPSEIVAFSDDMPDLAEWVQARMRAAASDRAPELGSDGCAAVVQLMSPTFQVEIAASANVRADDRVLIELTEQQFMILSALSEIRRALIAGGPGSGKSILAIEKARRLADQGLRTLLVCFNRALADHNQRTLGSADNLTATTFHDLWLQYAHRGSLIESTWVDNPPHEFWDQQLPEMFLAVLSDHPEWAFDAIVIDEGQDFSAAAIETLELALADGDDSILYVFADDEQLVHGDAGDVSSTLSTVQRFSLPENLRNTAAIHRAAGRFRHGSPLSTRAPEGRAIEPITAREPDKPLREISRLLHRLINEEGFKPHEIAVLTGRGVSTTVFAGAKALGVFKCVSAPGEVASVTFDTIRRFKGLDSPVVVLIELESVIEDAALMHVAITRARSHLVVIGSKAVVQTIANGPAAV